ncbi:hypothetical protein T03_15754, partial [Trichinella britovi]
LSVKEKLAIIYALNDGTKNSSVCEQFGSSQSTVSVILKNQSAILDARENGIASAKRRVDPQTLYHQQQLDELRRLAVADLRPLTEAYDELASNSSTSLDTATYFLTWD